MSDKPIILTNAPLYANMFAKLVPVAREHGYALAVHGSFARDMDIVAVPWVEGASSAQELVDAIIPLYAFYTVEGPELMLHGRLCWTLAFPGEVFIDLSVMPLVKDPGTVYPSTGHVATTN